MKPYEPHTFSIPSLDGISTESVTDHISLYQAYVKNFNAMSQLVEELSLDAAKNSLAIAEIRRRRSFEFGGMRLHELYFSQFEAGPVAPVSDSPFMTTVAAQYGTLGSLITQLTQTAMMRGPGWAILYFDTEAATFHIGFSEEQHQGHFAGLPIMLALDVWEHAFLKDHGVLGKADYVTAFFKNLNWKTVEQRFAVLAK